MKNKFILLSLIFLLCIGSTLYAQTAPVLAAIEGGALAYTENDVATAITASITVSDVDDLNVLSATIQITGNYQNGQDILSFVDQLGITGVWTVGTGLMTLTGPASLADFQTALRAVKYQNTSDDPSVLARTVSFTVTGDDGPSNTPTRDITVAAVNDAPVLAAIEGGALAYTENDPATIITSAITVADVDDTNIESATVVITGNFQSGEDVLSFVNQLGITGTWTVGTGTMSLAGSTTKANYQTALRAVKYQNTSDNPSVLARTVTFTVNDGDVNSNLPTRNITVAAVNDAPVLAAIEGTALSYAAGAAATAITSAITVSDVDDTNIESATIQITGNYQNGQDVLSFVDQLGIAGTWTVGTGLMTLTGSTTKANYQTALRAVKYQNTSSTPITSLRTISFKVNDGDANSNIPTRNVIVVYYAPINGLTGVSVLPTLTWTAVESAAYYKLYVDDAIGFGSANYNGVNVGNVTTKTFDATITNFPLINGTLYYWKVEAYTGGNALISTEGTYHFTTTPAMTVSLSTPTNDGTIYLSPASYSWYLSTPTTGLTFVLQYMIAASAPTAESDWSGATSVTTTSLTSSNAVLYGKTYYWRVLVKRTTPLIPGETDYLYYPAPTTFSKFTTAGGTSVTVTPSWPISATVYTNAPTLYWYLDQYASGLKYQVKYGTSSTDTTPADGELDSGTKLPTDVNLIADGSSNLYLTLPTLTPGTQYFWQVRAYYAAGDLDASPGDPTTGTGGFSAWTTPTSFTTNGTGTVQIPIPSYPTGGVTIYTTTPIIYWYLNTAATGLYYEIEYDLLANALTSGVNSADETTTIQDQMFKQMPSLTPGATYHYKVRSHTSSTLNAGTKSGWSDEATFIVAGGTTASYAVASYPIGNPTVYTNQPTLYWYLEGSSLGISSYIVKYKKTAAPADWTAALGGPNTANDGQYTGLSTATFSKQITTDLTYGATYYWAVYATGTANPINALGVGSFTVVGGTGTTTITLSTPTDASTVYSTSATLNWYVNGSSAGITDYTVQVSQSDVFASYFFNGTVTAPSTFKALTGLTNGATYYWKVKGNYAVDPSTAWSSTFSFTVNTGSPSIVQPLVGGPNNVTVNTASPTLSWVLQAPTAANSTYEVQLAENPNFQSAKTFSSSKSNMVVSGLAGGKSYFWKVRSRDGTGNTSYYSGTGQFRVNSSVTAVEEKEVIPTQFELSQNYPNPFNPSTRIAYALPQNSYVSIKVYDMLGREVKALVNNEMSAGNHSVDWNGDGNNGTKAASGTYVYRITAGNFVAVKKMILIK